MNRSERTVRRWEEKESLPVHRLQHDKRGSVYAYSQELDDWRASRQQMVDVAPSSDADAGVRIPTRWRWLVSAGVLTALAVATVAFVQRRPATARRTLNPEAVRAYERGRFSANAGRVQVQSGIRSYQEAIRLEPSFAAAWSGLAVAHIALAWYGETPAKATLSQAKIEAARALELDPSSSAPWRVLAFVNHYLDWDHRTAEMNFRKAIALNPKDQIALSWFSEFLLNVRRFDEAEHFTALAQDPGSKWLEPMTVAANVLYLSGRTARAIDEYRRVLELDPNNGVANHFLGRAMIANGQYSLAVEQFRKSNELLGRVPYSVADLAYGLARAGERTEAERLLADLVRRSEQGYYPAFAVAQIHLGFGDAGAALDWLERAAAERHLGYYLPSVDPIYEPLRSHPRFQALLQQMNLPQS